MKEETETMKSTNNKLTKFEKQVLKCIPSGRQHPITSNKLAVINNTAKRNITYTIQKLRIKGVLIGSSRLKDKSGYYRIQTVNEFFEVIGMLNSERNTLSKTISAMMNTFNNGTTLTGQQDLFELDEDEEEQ
ncbi:hypothetical protein L2505_05640 [Lactobacillus gasseri]|nr:hypothetical protein [Lactobacillus gasseri]MCZ3767458.1 hypothetical protein [Lactobacillus gasseri]MCZ3771025.1 hypothetical protein [Lactobacillus gasseri]MCZ3774536.1 hypothetical protein [Lactobacillus gasseri]MCZ3776314.1 hypothetical protein [Lactobacillus gasseri]